MERVEIFLKNKPGLTFLLILTLAIPAFFINLGLLPLFADEPTRANVALEMILTGNYSVPTIGGEYYYNKPPLYNWLLAAIYLSAGNFSEFTTRLPAIVPMFLFAATIYAAVAHFLKDKRIALLSGILFIVNGRMLIYDSMLGHIDIFYSWLTFISFMLIYHFYERKNWLLLFLTSYLITAITFLAKGLPSIVFQGFTIIALLLSTGNFRKFFSWQHIVSGLICLIIIGLYFYNYSLHNDDLQGYLATIWDQSSRRTAAEFSLADTFLHLLLFPFEHAGHLFPASLLLLFCMHKNFWNALKSNSFLKYIALIFAVNIVVYWLSPQTRPRYLMMLYPLAFIIWSHAYYTYRDQLPKTSRIFNQILLTLAILVTLLVPAAFFFDLQEYTAHLPGKVALVFSGCALFAWMIYKIDQRLKILPFLAFLMIVRLGFSWFVLPHRLEHMTDNYFKQAAIEMGRISKGHAFYFYQYHPSEPDIPRHDRLIFYIQRERMAQVKFTEDKAKPGYYFTFDRDMTGDNVQLIRDYRSLKFYKVE